MQRLIELRCTGEIRPGIFSVGSSGRDIRRATREGGHPAKVVGFGKGERASRVGEDEGTPHSHGRIPTAVPGSNQCQDHGRSFALIGRATIPVASLRSLIDCCISFYPPTNLLFETVARKIESIQRFTRRKEGECAEQNCTDLFSHNLLSDKANTKRYLEYSTRQCSIEAWDRVGCLQVRLRITITSSRRSEV